MHIALSFSVFVVSALSCLLGVDGAALHRRGTTSQITQSQWKALNTSVGGRLFAGYPLAKPCYSIYNGVASTPNATACSQVQQLGETDLFIASNYGGFQNTNWGSCQNTAQTCALNFNNPKDASVYTPPNNCYQGSVSNYYIQVQNASDAAAGMAFAQKNGIPISIKNSGHDYKGRSAAPGSLALWTNMLKTPIQLTKGFVPDGCSGPVADGVTFGSGENFVNLYNFAEANNITIVGGSSRTVGIAGGWISGAGHSSLSNTLGLGVDNVLQLRTVLPDGTYVTANRCQNQDLFYALRGGGGSTFGVNIEMTTTAHPQVTLQVAYIRFISGDPLSVFQFLTICVENANQWAADGWGGYIEPGAETSQASGLVLATPKLNYSQAVASMSQLRTYVSSLTLENIALNNSIETVTSFYQFYSQYLVPNAEVVGISTAVGSRLIPQANFNGSMQQQTINTLSQISTMMTYPFAGASSQNLVTYGAPVQYLVTAPNNYPTSGNDSSISPAWQTAVWHVIVSNTFSNQASAKTIASAFQSAHKATEMLEAITPGSGAYQNEADTFESDPIGAFWGQTNYDKLLAIKQTVDPNNILTCWQCIGWNPSDARYNCYPEAPANSTGYTLGIPVNLPTSATLSPVNRGGLVNWIIANRPFN